MSAEPFPGNIGIQESIEQLKTKTPEICKAIEKDSGVLESIKKLKENPHLWDFKSYQYSFPNINWNPQIFGDNFFLKLVSQLQAESRQLPYLSIDSVQNISTDLKRFGYVLEMDPKSSTWSAIRLQLGNTYLPVSFTKGTDGMFQLEGRRKNHNIDDEGMIRLISALSGAETEEDKKRVENIYFTGKIKDSFVSQNFMNDPASAFLRLFLNARKIRCHQFLDEEETSNYVHFIEALTNRSGKGNRNVNHFIRPVTGYGNISETIIIGLNDSSFASQLNPNGYYLTEIDPAEYTSDDYLETKQRKLFIPITIANSTNAKLAGTIIEAFIMPEHPEKVNVPHFETGDHEIYWYQKSLRK